MIHAVPNGLYTKLKANGTLAKIQKEVMDEDMVALAARVARGELVEAKTAGRHCEGSRDRCYACGDEVTPFHWKEKKNVVYFKHMTRRDCIGSPSNPRAVHQPAS